MKIGLARHALAMLLLLSSMPLPAQTPQLDASVAAIKGHRRVVIAEFGVEFFTQIAAASQRGAAGAAVTTRLAGVGPEDFQAITDQAYAETVEALKRAGFEVLDPAILQGNATYRELDAQYGHPSPWVNEDKHMGVDAQISVIHAPAGMRAFYQSSLKISEGRGSIGKNIDAQNQGRARKEGEVAKALDAVLLHVHYLASYGQPNKRSHNALFSGRTARAKVKITPMLWADDTELQFVTEAGGRTFGNGRMRHNGWVALDDPLTSDVDLFATADTTSDSTKRGNAVVGVLGILTGTGMAQKNGSAEVTPTSAQAYREVFGGLISNAANAFAAQLGSGI